MLEEYNRAIQTYQATWRELVTGRHNKSFFEALNPHAIGWKVADIAAFDSRLATLRPHCDQIHLGWVDERWIATVHLKDTAAVWGIRVIKLMQRRPASIDAVGLDHIDFYAPNEEQTRQVMAAEPELQWTHETSNPYCNWVSVWFANTEAKLRSKTVLDVCIAELEQINKGLLQ